MKEKKCDRCGAAILLVNVDGKEVPLDKHTLDERYLLQDGKWKKGKSGLSHYTTCQHRRRYRLL